MERMVLGIHDFKGQGAVSSAGNPEGILISNDIQAMNGGAGGRRRSDCAEYQICYDYGGYRADSLFIRSRRSNFTPVL